MHNNLKKGCKSVSDGNEIALPALPVTDPIRAPIYRMKDFHFALRFVGGEGFTAFICFACPESWLIISGDSSPASNAEPVTRPSS